MSDSRGGWVYIVGSDGFFLTAGSAAPAASCRNLPTPQFHRDPLAKISPTDQTERGARPCGQLQLELDSQFEQNEPYYRSNKRHIDFNMEMDLRQLKYFIAVAEEGHITRAAERLGMQQPPLSQRIKKLEQQLDVRLFHRKARGVELTEAGRALLENAHVMVAQFEHAIEAIRRTARGEQGRISVGVTPTSPFHPFVPRVIRAFRQAYPLVSLVLEECFSNELVELLRSERIDAAFIRTPPTDPQGLAMDTLLDEELVVALPNDHVLAQSGGGGDAALPLKAFARETFNILGSQDGLGLYMTTIAACRAAGFTPNIGQEASRLASTLNLVAIGSGISVVPASLRRMQIDGVAYRRLKGASQLKSPLILASRRGDPSAVVRQFLNLVKRTETTLSATTYLLLCIGL